MWTLLLLFIIKCTLAIEDLGLKECQSNGGTNLTEYICMPKSYDKDSIPKPVNEPLKIESLIVFGDVREVNEQAFTTSLMMWINLKWLDNQLVGNVSNQGVEHPSEETQDLVWIPDLHIRNLIDFKEIKVFHQGAELFLENTELGVMVTIAFHGIITTSCKMKFNAYPFDTQKCHILIGTDSATSNNLMFTFNLQYNENAEHQHFSEFAVQFQEISENVTWNKLANLGTKKNVYHVVGFEISLSRIGTPYMFSYFLPAFGMSCIGSISFLIMPESVPGRVALLLTLMLLLISFFNAIQNQIPKSDGMTAIGLYLLSSLLAVFMALFEYGIILFRMKQRQVEKMKNSSTEIRINAKKVAWNVDNVGMNEALMTDYKIDQFAFVIYIGILILFNFVYWVTFAPLMHV